ncbi:allantoinase AllB [bacterium]|nr:allantoinase AllB [bacterium]
MAPSTIFLQSTRVYTPGGLRPAALKIIGERIAAILPHGGAPFEAAVRDFGDQLILPGAVDLHVHLNEPGRTAWEGFFTGTSAAIAGGITTLVDMPLNSSPVTISPDALAEKRAAASARLHTDVAFHGGLVADAGEEALALLRQGIVAMKAFMIDSGLDEFPAAAEADLRRLMPRMAELGLPLLAHAELPSTEAPPVTDPRSYRQYAASRPHAMELRAIELLIRLCRETRCAVHIVHVATAEALPLIASAKAEGLPITAETCPHYLAFCEEEIADGDTRFKCAPPIRDRANREALWDGVRSGVIDTIGSDHSPCPPSLKSLDAGDFTAAWGGISSLQLLLPAVYTGCMERGISLERMVEILSSAPARIVGLDHLMGSIEVGKRANLVVLDDATGSVVSASQLLHRHPITPWDGYRMACTVRSVWLRGIESAVEGVPTPPRGIAIDSRDLPGIQMLNNAPLAAAESMLEKCCGAKRWWQTMADRRPFQSRAHLMATAEQVATMMTESDRLEAFTHHPKIGDVDSLRKKFAATAAWSASEQGSVAAAAEEVLQGLKKGNDDYEQRFGFIFIVCATGKSAAEMLALLNARIGNDRATEIANAAREQRKITRIRLDKLLA